MNRILLDARYALRHYSRRPGVTATMLAVLVIGMTIATSLFSFTRAYMTEPAPGVARAEDLVRIRAKWSTPWGMSRRQFEREELDAQLESATSFRAVTAWTKAIVALERAGADDPDWVTAQFVTGPYFEVLGVRLAAGRGLPAERADGDALVAVVSRPLRERHFASDAEALGRTLLVAGRPVTIVGVAPARFRGVDANDDDVQTLWLPEAARTQVAPSTKPARYVAAARLAPGGDLATASAAAAAIASHVPRDPEVDVRMSRSADVVRMAAMNGDPNFEREMAPMLTGLSTLALLVLLVTGMNASALQTGLAMTRGREIAMRLSLGASRGRVLRQLLTESGLLGLVAGTLALVLLAAIEQLGAAILANFPFPLTIGASSIAFTFGIALTAGVLAGLSPALHAARAGVAATLKASAGGSPAKRGGLQRGLVVAQLVLTQPLVVLLTALVLIIVTEYRRESAQDASSAVATIALRSSDATTGPLDPAREIERLAARLESVPAVARAIGDPGGIDHLDDYAAARSGTGVAEPIDLEAAVVAPGWFETMDRAIRAGRAFDEADARPRDARDDRPVVIGEDLAAALWPGRSPIGERLVPPAESQEPALVVVGVAETLPGTERRPGSEYEVFVPPSAPPAGIALLVRLRGDPATALRDVRAALREAAPGLGIVELRTLEQLAQDSKRELLVGTGALAGLGILALFISAIGLYAVVAFAVSQRNAEIAVRLAVGARPGQVVRHTMGDGIRLTTIALVAGLPISLAGLSLLVIAPKMLPPVPLWQVAVFAVLCVGGIATAATWMPARRAARVAPATVLRSE